MRVITQGGYLQLEDPYSVIVAKRAGKRARPARRSWPPG